MTESIGRAPAAGEKLLTVTRTAGQRQKQNPLDQLPGWTLALGLITLLLILWELGVKVLNVSQFLLPPPSRIFAAFYQGFASGVFWRHTWITLSEILLGFGIAVILGLVLAVAMSSFPLVEKAVLPIIVVMQTVPKVALAPLFLVWFGFGMESKVLTTALIAFFPILVNSMLGFNAASSEQADMLKSFGASRSQILVKLRFPSALPSILAGLDVAVVLSVIGAIVAEFVGAQAGLGYLIMASNTSLDVATMFAVLIILSIIGVVLHYIIVAISKKATFWSEENRAKSVKLARSL